MAILCVLLILLVLFDAMEDSLNRKQETKELGHRGGELFVLTVFIFGIIWDPVVRDAWDWFGAILSMLMGYMGFRFSLFNPLWNLFSGQKLNYLGETVWQDRVEKQYMPAWSFWITRIFAFGFGILCVWMHVHIYQ